MENNRLGSVSNWIRSRLNLDPADPFGTPDVLRQDYLDTLARRYGVEALFNATIAVNQIQESSPFMNLVDSNSWERVEILMLRYTMIESMLKQQPLTIDPSYLDHVHHTYLTYVQSPEMLQFKIKTHKMPDILASERVSKRYVNTRALYDEDTIRRFRRLITVSAERTEPVTTTDVEKTQHEILLGALIDRFPKKKGSEPAVDFMKDWVYPTNLTEEEDSVHFRRHKPWMSQYGETFIVPSHSIVDQPKACYLVLDGKQSLERPKDAGRQSLLTIDSYGRLYTITFAPHAYFPGGYVEKVTPMKHDALTVQQAKFYATVIAEHRSYPEKRSGLHRQLKEYALKPNTTDHEIQMSLIRFFPGFDIHNVWETLRHVSLLPGFSTLELRHVLKLPMQSPQQQSIIALIHRLEDLQLTYRKEVPGHYSWHSHAFAPVLQTVLDNSIARDTADHVRQLHKTVFEMYAQDYFPGRKANVAFYDDLARQHAQLAGLVETN